MNIPIMMNTDELESIRDELDQIIQRFKEISNIGEEKQKKIAELVGKENGSKIMDILFEEIL